MYTQKELKDGELRVFFKDVSNKKDWREATEAEIKAQELDPLKEAKIAELYEYDKSSEVNIFYYQNVPMWLPLEQRNNLLNNSIPACQKAGAKTIYLSLGDISADFPIELAKEMLLQVEYYAKLAFDVTDKHMRAIQALTTAEEIEAYDFTTGYPEKVRFEAL